MNKISLVIFDFDGTLYDFKGLNFKILRQLSLFEIFLAGKDRKIRRSLKGKYFENYENFKAAYFSKFPFISKEKAENWYYNRYLKAMTTALEENFKARENVNSFFSTLHSKGLKIVIFSDYPVVRERMSAIGLNPDSADAIYNAEELGGLKPAKEPFLKIANDFAVAPENCLVIGDRSDTDGAGAKACGMKFIQLETHKTKPHDALYAVSWAQLTALEFV